MLSKVLIHPLQVDVLEQVDHLVSFDFNPSSKYGIQLFILEGYQKIIDSMSMEKIKLGSEINNYVPSWFGKSSFDYILCLFQSLILPFKCFNAGGTPMGCLL